MCNLFKKEFRVLVQDLTDQEKEILRKQKTMKRDIKKTKVYFAFNEKENDLTAFLPELDYYNYPSDTKMCYAHIGQHSGCSLSYILEETREATEDEYKELFKELESIGYRLEVVNSVKVLQSV